MNDCVITLTIKFACTKKKIKPVFNRLAYNKNNITKDQVVKLIEGQKIFIDGIGYEAEKNWHSPEIKSVQYYYFPHEDLTKDG